MPDGTVMYDRIPRPVFAPCRCRLLRNLAARAGAGRGPAPAADPSPIDGGRGGRPRRIGADRGPTPRFRPEAAPTAVGWKLQRGTLRSGRRDCIGQTALVMSAIIPLRSLVRDGSAASTGEPPSRCRRSTRPAVAPCAGGMLGTPLPGPASFRSCTARRRDAPVQRIQHPPRTQLHRAQAGCSPGRLRRRRSCARLVGEASHEAIEESARNAGRSRCRRSTRSQAMRSSATTTASTTPGTARSRAVSASTDSRSTAPM